MKIMKQKSNLINKKAFTLIELLIVIAIIGILFIVLVSKVDFAVDKAKATGVQTDFRSFQMAFEQVARENNGFNTLGWDTGDTYIADRIRNSYDAGDTNQNGIQEAGEVWTGRMVYAENYTGTYTLTNPKDPTDKSAYRLLESAINANLDPKLHITIGDDGSIMMANDARDPWKNNYHGQYITNAYADNMDRGAIILYSNGANGILGSKAKIEEGVAKVTVSLTDADTPDFNKDGIDDYSVAVFYSYANGYGEILTITTGFSNNLQDIYKPLEKKEPAGILTFQSYVGTVGTFVEINERIKLGNHYRVGVGKSNTYLNEDLSDLPKWNGGDDIIASIGDPILIAECNSEGKCVRACVAIALVNPPELSFPANPSGDLSYYVNTYGWSSIQELAQSKYPKKHLKEYYGIDVGDRVVSKGVTYILVDINEYNGEFRFMYNSGQKYHMNSTDTNVGGYKESEMALKLNQMYQELETSNNDLYNVIKKVNIQYQDNVEYISGDGSTNIVIKEKPMNDVGLYLVTCDDVGIHNSFSAAFDYFYADKNTSRDLCKDIVDSADNWWTRDISNTNCFTAISVLYNGGAMSSYATEEYLIVPVFVIG